MSKMSEIDALNRVILEKIDSHECLSIAALESTAERAMNALALHLMDDLELLPYVDCLTILPTPYTAVRRELFRAYMIDRNEFNGELYDWVCKNSSRWIDAS